MPIYKTDGKKDGKQRYEVKINYTDVYGNYKQLKRTTYGNAEAKLLEQQLLERVKTISDSSVKTVNELYDEYIVSIQPEIRRVTFENKQCVFRNHILPFIGKYKLDKVTVSIIQDWKNELSKKQYKISSLKVFYKELNALFNYAIKMQYIVRNPVSLVGVFKEPYFESTEEKLHYYTKEEFMKFIATARQKAIETSDWEYYVFFCIAFFTGMRKGEIYALKWSDIEGDTVCVRRSINQNIKGDHVETSPKTKSSYRKLQMPQPLIDVLTEHKQRHQVRNGFTDDFRVCGGIRCIRDNSVAKYNKDIAQAAGLPRLKIHDFRHTHATLLVNEGINIQEIARRLGHSNTEMTWRVYSHLYPREEERAITVLDKVELK